MVYKNCVVNFSYSFQLSYKERKIDNCLIIINVFLASDGLKYYIFKDKINRKFKSSRNEIYKEKQNCNINNYFIVLKNTNYTYLYLHRTVTIIYFILFQGHLQLYFSYIIYINKVDSHIINKVGIYKLRK